MNKSIIALVVILLLLAGGWYVWSMQEGMPADTATQNTPPEGENAPAPADRQDLEPGEVAPSAVIVYTDEGFEPAQVTIDVGQTVSFVNESSRGLWVGSDRHPTHTDYPVSSENDCLGSSFDTCESLGAGEVWQFTFTEAGTWGYHNHVLASHKGSIVVNE